MPSLSAADEATLTRGRPAEAPARPTRELAEDGLPTPRRHLAAAAVLAAIVLAVLDGAIANVALPTIAGALQVSPAASVWVVTGYQVALVMALLPCAALGESLGYRRVFIAGVVLFTAASALCGLPVAQVDDDGSPRAERLFALWNPPLTDEHRAHARRATWRRPRCSRLS